jgi:Domain of unknown function (DUF4288)
MVIDQQSADVYVAVVVYESSSDSPAYEPLFEESFMILKASSLEEAQQKANQNATAHMSSFKNEAGDSIVWKLKHIVDVNQVLYDANTDGAEIYARHFRDYQAYREFEPLLSGKEL